MSMNLTKITSLIPLCLISYLSSRANLPEPSSALAYQQTTNTRIVVEENFLRFYTGGSERMTIDENGNVGIGTLVPETKLDIYQENGGTIAFFRSKEGIIKIKSEGPTTENPTYGNYILATTAENNGYENIGLKAAPGIPQLIVATNGNVGIGTDSPNEKLEVAGSIKFSSEYSHILWPVHATHQYGGGITGDDGQFKRLTLYHGHSIAFETGSNSRSHSNTRIYINSSGNVGIGTTGPTYKLHVNGDTRSNRFISNTNTYADFVFEDDYRLAPLSEVEKYIKKNNHLPDIPSEAEAKKNGVDLQEMQAKLLQKIEELTLYVIEQNKRIDALQKENQHIKNKLN